MGITGLRPVKCRNRFLLWDAAAVGKDFERRGGLNVRLQTTTPPGRVAKSAKQMARAAHLF